MEPGHIQSTLPFATTSHFRLGFCTQAQDGCPWLKPMSWPQTVAIIMLPGAQPPFKKQLGTNRLLRAGLESPKCYVYRGRT